MIRFCVLASGSRGNATYVEAGGLRLLIDAGLRCRTLAQRMALLGLQPEALDGILVTHEHSDHVQGLDAFAAKYDLPVYANEGTAAVVERQCRSLGRPVPDFILFQSQVPFALGDAVVTPVPVSHDTAEPVAYTLEDGDGRFGYFTDLGYLSQGVAEALRGCTAAVLESNHDLYMLEHSDRSYLLKQRIRGASGHLSNDQACEAIELCRPEALRTLVLAHLSQECNTPEIAAERMGETLRRIGRRDVAERLAIAEQDRPLPFMS